MQTRKYSQLWHCQYPLYFHFTSYQTEVFKPNVKMSCKTFTDQLENMSLSIYT